MRIFIPVFAVLMIGSLLFCVYFMSVPVFDPMRFERHGMDFGSLANSAGYYNAGWTFLVIFCVSSICLAWMIASSERNRRIM